MEKSGFRVNLRLSRTNDQQSLYFIYIDLLNFSTIKDLEEHIKHLFSIKEDRVKLYLNDSRLPSKESIHVIQPNDIISISKKKNHKVQNGLTSTPVVENNSQNSGLVNEIVENKKKELLKNLEVIQQNEPSALISDSNNDVSNLNLSVKRKRKRKHKKKNDESAKVEQSIPPKEVKVRVLANESCTGNQHVRFEDSVNTNSISCLNESENTTTSVGDQDQCKIDVTAPVAKSNGSWFNNLTVLSGVPKQSKIFKRFSSTVSELHQEISDFSKINPYDYPKLDQTLGIDVIIAFQVCSTGTSSLGALVLIIGEDRSPCISNYVLGRTVEVKLDDFVIEILHCTGNSDNVIKELSENYNCSENSSKKIIINCKSSDLTNIRLIQDVKN